MKNFNRSPPWLKVPQSAATRTLKWIARFHSHTYSNAVTTTLCNNKNTTTKNNNNNDNMKYNNKKYTASANVLNE